MSTGLQTYQRLLKMSKKKLIKKETMHNEARERFSSRITDMTSTVSNDERRYAEAKERAREAIPISGEKAISEALEAKLIRCEILARKSALALLRANEFYHNAMIHMTRDAQLGVQYDAKKLDAMIPLDLRKPIIDSMVGMKIDGMFDPLVDEMDGPPPPVIPHRFTLDSKNEMAKEIELAGGVEVFAIGTLNDQGKIDSVEIVCRGNQTSVPAAVSRVEPGQVVIHNHPNGVMEASEADMQLAHIYKERGIGVAIVDNEVTKVLWVVEPREEVVE